MKTPGTDTKYMMQLKALILMLCIAPGLATASVGTLVGDWWQNHPDKALAGENHAITQPVVQDSELLRVTLGVKGHGTPDSVEFFLVVSSRENNESCRYSVEEIVIDSTAFPVSSTTHRSDIGRIRAATTDQQKQLWKGFRQGKTLSLVLNQACGDTNNTGHESYRFDFSLKGSNAAYHFVAGLKPPQKRVKPKPKIEEPVNLPKVITTEKTEYESSNAFPYLMLTIALIAVLLVVSRIKRQSQHIPPEFNPDSRGARVEPGMNSKPGKSAGFESAVDSFRAMRAPIQKPETQQPTTSTPDQRIENLPEYKVDHVIDGDTVVVSNRRWQLRIRLDAIDCPEDGQEWGDIATAGMIKLIGGKHVRLEEHGTDRYERMLATLYVRNENSTEWTNVNERMVTLGHAWVMRRFYKHLSRERQNKLNQLERWAKARKVGLWKNPDPTPPWNWRQTKQECV